MIAYRPQSKILKDKFEEIKKILDKAVNKHDNILMARNLNILTITKNDGNDYLCDLTDIFSFSHLVSLNTVLQI